jgi:hypothetical protein
MILEHAILNIRKGKAREFEAALEKARPLIEACKQATGTCCLSGGVRLRHIQSASASRPDSKNGARHCTRFTSRSRRSSITARRFDVKCLLLRSPIVADRERPAPKSAVSPDLREPPLSQDRPSTKSGGETWTHPMMYLLAFFCSPLALLLTGKPISALFNFILYILSIVFWITIIFHHVGFLLWGIGVLHAVLTINNAREERRARRIIAASKSE